MTAPYHDCQRGITANPKERAYLMLDISVLETASLQSRHSKVEICDDFRVAMRRAPTRNHIRISVTMGQRLKVMSTSTA